MLEDKLSVNLCSVNVVLSDFYKNSFICHSVFRKYSTSIKMSSTRPPNEQETLKERKPGLRNVQTTMLFRAVNPELFIKPNKPVMAFGLIAITLCVAYLGYLHATAENKKDLYEAVDSEGSRYMRRKTSKWD
uniref:Small integral membrane protein 8 n=2 Tax=Accipitrinae TaxID=8955 RepID=A0A8B9RQQ5_9AVES